MTWGNSVQYSRLVQTKMASSVRAISSAALHLQESLVPGGQQQALGSNCRLNLVMRVDCEHSGRSKVCSLLSVTSAGSTLPTDHCVLSGVPAAASTAMTQCCVYTLHAT